MMPSVRLRQATGRGRCPKRRNSCGRWEQWWQTRAQRRRCRVLPGFPPGQETLARSQRIPAATGTRPSKSSCQQRQNPVSLCVRESCPTRRIPTFAPSQCRRSCRPATKPNPRTILPSHLSLTHFTPSEAYDMSRLLQPPLDIHGLISYIMFSLWPFRRRCTVLSRTYRRRQRDGHLQKWWAWR